MPDRSGRHVRTGDVRFGDDFEQRDAGAVEINAAVAVEVKILADVLFEVRAGDADAGDAAVEFEVQITVGWGGFVVLGDLVILRHVGVEIILAIELGEAGDGAIEQQAGEYREAQGFVVGDGQDTGQAEADGADVGVGGRAEFIGAAAPHL